MRETLYLHLHDTAADAAVAIRVDGEFRGRVERLRLDEALQRCAGRRVIVIVSGDDVRLESVNLPIRQAARLRQAVPYALEDQLAEDIDDLHFAIGQRHADGHTVAVVSHRRMRAWQGLFAEHGVRPEALVPEPLLLPLNEGEWSVLLAPERAVVRSGPAAGFACPLDQLPSYLALAAPPPELRLRLHLVDGAPHEFPELQQPTELVPGYGDALELLIERLAGGTPVDLLQGPYSMRESARRYWRPWLLPAACAAAWLVAVLVGSGLQAARLGNEAEALRLANEARFRSIFPADQRIVDLRAQLDQKLSGAGGGDASRGLLPLLGIVAEGLPAAPGLELRTIQFQGGELYLSLTGEDLQSLEKLRAWFAQRADARLEVQTANAGAEGVQIRVKVSSA